MANLIPFVDPPNNEQGIAIGYLPTAIFEQVLETGSISASTCFIVEIPTHNQPNLDAYIANSSLGNIVPSKVTQERINLLNNNVYTGLDFGDDVDSGEQYRTKIYIKPESPLKPNTTYATLLSKDLSLVTVFDPEPNGGNSGTGGLLAQGSYTGLATDTYTITITNSGSKNTAKYSWSRSSDAYNSVAIEARGRLITIDRGLKIEFKDGTYTIGDSFIVRVKPQDKQAEIFSWTFSTSSGDYQTPTDNKSGTLLNLPVSGGPTTSTDSFYITKIEPSNATSMLKIPRKASALVGDVVFMTKDYTSAFNSYTVEFIDGATAGAEIITLGAGTIEVALEDGVSTAQQVIDAFNGSLLVNEDFEAVIYGTASPSALQEVETPVKFSKGIDATTILITFNKDIDSATIDDKIKVTSYPIYPAGPQEELLFSTSVSGKVLTITLEEQE